MEQHLAADCILIGKIYTGDIKNEFCEALVIKDGIISFVGREAQALRYFSSETKCIRGKGLCCYELPIHSLLGLFLPGFFDSHVHAITGSIQEMQCALYRETSLLSALQKVKQYSLDHPHLPTILGAGWQVAWEDLPSGLPRATLVRVLPTFFSLLFLLQRFYTLLMAPVAAAKMRRARTLQQVIIVEILNLVLN
jgi:predicted amidohydrolase YtcJ